MKKLTILVGLMMSLALALPGGTEAAALSEVKKLLASDAQADDGFGVVAISGDTLISGAPQRDGSRVGGAYIFERNQGGLDNWGEMKKLVSSDAQFNDFFGSSLAVSGDTAIVGSSQGFGGTGFGAGAAYIFERNQGGLDNWGEVKKLVSSDAQFNGIFGSSLAVSGDTAIVGAGGEDAGGIGGFATGAAYVFERNRGGANNWGEVTTLTASDGQGFDVFGVRVAMGGGTAIVGALEGISGGTGAAYVFERDQGGLDNWGESKKLTASDAQAGDGFGVVAISGGTLIVGAPGEDAGASNVGAAYVFETPQEVGGLVVDLDEGPLSAAQPSGGSPGRLAGTVAGVAAAVAAGSLALGGAAWYARKRRA